MARLAWTAKMVLRAHEELLGLQDQAADRALQAHREWMARMVKTGYVDPPVSRGQRVRPVQRVPQVPQVPRARGVSQAHLAWMETMGLMAYVAHLV